jgi:cyclopropane fatty-acyl-phospholipid synthase-like methyltransferase
MMLTGWPTETERLRYETLLSNLVAWRHLFVGQRVLDFGASWGTSAIALARAGAGEVVGVEPDAARVDEGRERVAREGLSMRISLVHTADTQALNFSDGAFPFVLSNGVLEHIPQPRDRFVKELWRLVRRGGHLMVTETPNTYWPVDTHTTGLWFNHWLSRDAAYRRAVRNGRFDAARADWATSGWRGMSYRELVRPIRDYRLIPDGTRLRHHVLSRVGLPASLIDPYPVWVLRKEQ